MQDIFNIFISFLTGFYNYSPLREYFFYLVSLCMFGFVWNRHLR